MSECEYDGCKRIAVSQCMIIDKDGWEHFVDLCEYHINKMIDKEGKEKSAKEVEKNAK